MNCAAWKFSTSRAGKDYSLFGSNSAINLALRELSLCFEMRDNEGGRKREGEKMLITFLHLLSCHFQEKGTYMYF